MTDYKQLCAELVDDLELCDWPYKLKEAIRADIERARAALAEPEPQRRCLYSPAQIAECGGPCEQGPEHCDCGELCVTEPEPEYPSDKELLELMPETMRDEFSYAARVSSDVTGVKPGIFRVALNTTALQYARAVLARWGK